MKNIRIFYLKIFIVLVVKFSAYLNRYVFVMISGCYSLELPRHSVLINTTCFIEKYRYLRFYANLSSDALFVCFFGSNTENL